MYRFIIFTFLGLFLISVFNSSKSDLKKITPTETLREYSRPSIEEVGNRHNLERTSASVSALSFSPIYPQLEHTSDYRNPEPPEDPKEEIDLKQIVLKMKNAQQKWHGILDQFYEEVLYLPVETTNRIYEMNEFYGEKSDQLAKSIASAQYDDVDNLLVQLIELQEKYESEIRTILGKRNYLRVLGLMKKYNEKLANSEGQVSVSGF